MIKTFEAGFTLHPAVNNGKRSQRLRPVIELPFRYASGESLDISSLIDSGADRSVSFKEVGEGLGIKFVGKPSEPVTGITGEESAWQKPVYVTIGNETIHIDVLWMDRKFDPDSDFMMSLGREKIFDVFDVSFTRDKKIIFSK